MNLLITLPDDSMRGRFLSKGCLDRLNRIATVAWNPHDRQFSAEELAVALEGIEVALTGWLLPELDRNVLGRASSLRLIAHLGGTVAPLATEDLYERGVRVCSGNRVMAGVVAEAILGYTLAGLRGLPALDRAMHDGAVWPRDLTVCQSLRGASLGFVGLGTVGRSLLDLLAPFGVDVSVFDPHIDSKALDRWPFAVRVGALESSLGGKDVVSIHASRTPETLKMIGSKELSQLDDSTLLVNAARGALIDEGALISHLETSRIRVVLDVYEEEPLPVGHPLRSMPNAILVPHMAGAPSHGMIGEAMVAETERYAAGQDLMHEIPLAQFRRMTR